MYSDNNLKQKVKVLDNRRRQSPKDKFPKRPGQKPLPKQTPRSNPSQKSKKHDANGIVDGIVPDIPNEVFVEILTQRFAALEQPFGIIIESLDSVFLCPETTVLSAVFQAVGNLKFLHCVILYDSFPRYFERKEAEENHKKEEEENKIKHLEQMTVEEISDLSDDDVMLYNNLQLEKRREKFKLKKEERANRKEMKILQEALKKKVCTKERTNTRRN
ncbi:uncharacterized protein LOC126267855 [Schistocerca gregaria]|uniref:uncharacterized protein LOC126267855 n=1 Tax=Schistocerca gregaria TaxID=7010 RepID=UPI00211E43A9|nr:uncharacterized protein LOC126267855 [Schistocerca gregaria]